MYTSTNAANTRIAKLIPTNDIESFRTLPSFKLCLINATERILPARPATKYAPISKIPWVMYRKKLNVAAPKYVDTVENPAKDATPAILDLNRFPIAVATVDAFHVKMNMAPVP